MSDRPPWLYDEFRQLGTDFEDAAEVAAYERNQRADPAAERALLARLGVARGHTVIDLGCGTGSFAREAARAGARVHAVDVSRAMLDYARDKAAGLDGLSFHHAGFLTYAHAGPPADLVVSRYALHHLPDFWKQAALVRVAAMLRAGGVLYLEDVVFSFDPADYGRGVEAWIAGVAKPQGEGFTAADFAAHVREEHSTWGWVLEGMLARAGFTVTEADYPDPAYARYVCTTS